MAAITVTGTLTRCELRRDNATDYNFEHRYSPNTEHSVAYLDCALRADDGQVFYFMTPRSNYNITSVPGAAIVTFRESIWVPDDSERGGHYEFPADHPWFAMTGDVSVATTGRPANKALVAKIKVGDQVTIRGRVKKQGHGRTGPYTVLNFVKKV